MMRKVLIINGSYRERGVCDQALRAMQEILEAKGLETETIHLRDHPIAFCTNCRDCTQQEGSSPGTCSQEDTMAQLIDKIESADSLVLASPTNFGTVTALFKRFMERLVVYAYWPWEQRGPVYRKAQLTQKSAVLLTTSAAPGLMDRLFFDTLKRLKQTAKTIGAKPVDTLTIGMIATQAHPMLSRSDKRRAERAALKLVP
jgi:multimeric flavodoxin WrbA